MKKMYFGFLFLMLTGIVNGQDFLKWYEVNNKKPIDIDIQTKKIPEDFEINEFQIKEIFGVINFLINNDYVNLDADQKKALNTIILNKDLTFLISEEYQRLENLHDRFFHDRVSKFYIHPLDIITQGNINSKDIARNILLTLFDMSFNFPQLESGEILQYYLAIDKYTGSGLFTNENMKIMHDYAIQYEINSLTNAFNGSWSSNMGEITFIENTNKDESNFVKAFYGNSADGQIFEGHVGIINDEIVLEGTWKRMNNKDIYGPIYFTLSKDRLSFSGYFEENGAKKPWKGQKILIGQDKFLGYWNTDKGKLFFYRNYQNSVVGLFSENGLNRKVVGTVSASAKNNNLTFSGKWEDLNDISSTGTIILNFDDKKNIFTGSWNTNRNANNWITIKGNR